MHRPDKINYDEESFITCLILTAKCMLREINEEKVRVNLPCMSKNMLIYNFIMIASLAECSLFAKGSKALEMFVGATRNFTL